MKCISLKFEYSDQNDTEKAIFTEVDIKNIEVRPGSVAQLAMHQA